MIQLNMSLGQTTLTQSVFLKGFSSQKPNIFENCDTPDELVFDAQCAQQTNKNLRPGRVVSGHKTAAVVLRLKIPPPERVWFFLVKQWRSENELPQTPMFRQSLSTARQNLPQQKKHGPQAFWDSRIELHKPNP